MHKGAIVGPEDYYYASIQESCIAGTMQAGRQPGRKNAGNLDAHWNQIELDEYYIHLCFDSSPSSVWYVVAEQIFAICVGERHRGPD